MAPLTQGRQSEDLSKYLESSQGRSYFVAAATTIFLAIFILFGVLPAYSAVFAQISTNEERDEAIAKYETKLETLRSFDAQAESDSNLINYFEDIFPEFDGTQDQVILRIFDTAALYNLTVMSMVISETEVGDQEIDVPLLDARVSSGILQVRLRGSREQLISYVDEIESSRFIFDSRSTTLSKIADDQLNIDNSGVEGDHQLILQLQFYYWGELDPDLTN